MSHRRSVEENGRKQKCTGLEEGKKICGKENNELQRHTDKERETKMTTKCNGIKELKRTGKYTSSDVHRSKNDDIWKKVKQICVTNLKSRPIKISDGIF